MKIYFVVPFFFFFTLQSYSIGCYEKAINFISITNASAIMLENNA